MANRRNKIKIEYIIEIANIKTIKEIKKLKSCLKMNCFKGLVHPNYVVKFICIE